MKIALTVSVLFLLVFPLLVPAGARAADPVIGNVTLTCNGAGGVYVEGTATDSDGNLDEITVSIRAYANEADCIAGTNQIGAEVFEHFMFDNKPARTEGFTFQCVPGQWYRGVVRADDSTGGFDVELSADCCMCEAPLMIPTLTDVGVILLALLMAGGGFVVLRRHV